MVHQVKGGRVHWKTTSQGPHQRLTHIMGVAGLSCLEVNPAHPKAAAEGLPLRTIDLVHSVELDVRV